MLIDSRIHSAAMVTVDLILQNHQQNSEELPDNHPIKKQQESHKDRSQGIGNVCEISSNFFSGLNMYQV